MAVPTLVTEGELKTDDSSNSPIIPFLARKDLELTTVSYRDEEGAIVKDPVRLKYFRLTPEQAFVLKLLDVPRTQEFLKRSLQRSYPTIHVESLEIQTLLQDLHTKGLVASIRIGQSIRLVLKRTEERRKEVIKAVSNPLYIRIPGLDADKFLGSVVRWFGWMFDKWFLLLASVFVTFCAIFAIDRYEEIRHRLPTAQMFFSGENLFLLWITIALTKIIHEFGHGLACKHFGGECRETGLVFLVLSPTLYCDTSDSWRFNNKWNRIAVGAAGMYFELLLSAFCVVIWWNSPSGAIQNMCLNIFFVSAISTLVFNINPLLKFDGYYIFSDFLEIPNLQMKATQALRSAVAWGAFGIQIPQSAFLPRSDRGWFISYAVTASVYRWIVMIGILGFMYQLLRPYRLEMMGLAFASISLTTGFARQGKQWYDILTAPRKQSMDRKKLAMTLVVLVSLLGSILWVPVPWYIEAPCYAQPVLAQNVYANVPGVLEEILVHPGMYVRKDSPIIRLRNDELIDRVESLRLDLAIAQAKRHAARVANDDAMVRLVEERATSLTLQLEKAERWLAQSIVLAPVDGWVVEAPVMSSERGVQETFQLKRWGGTPLSEKNLGAYFDVQTHLCTIAPSKEFEVVMAIDQENAGQVAEGKSVRVKLYGLPDSVQTSAVEKIASQATRVCPPELSATFGGPLVGTASPNGELMLDRGVLLANAPVALNAERMRSGIRGSARIFVSDHSVGKWLWRWAITKVWFRI